MQGYGWSQFRKMNLRRQNKGHADCIAQFIQSIKSGQASPIPYNELIEVTEASFAIVDQLLSG